MKEFRMWETEQIWPTPEQEDDCQAEGPDGADVSMIFFLKSAWKAKRHSNDAAVRPPKRLTAGKHGYRIRKWVK